MFIENRTIKKLRKIEKKNHLHTLFYLINKFKEIRTEIVSQDEQQQKKNE